jgi:hypothetical protein
MDLNLILIISLIILATILFGAFVVYFQLRRQWFDHQFEDRKIRQKNYRRLIHDLSEAAALGDDESHQRLMARLDSLIVIASPYAIEKLLEFQKFMRVSNVRVLHNSEIWLEQRDELSRDLVRTLREDIYGDEPVTTDRMALWRPLSRTIRKPGSRFEIVPFKRLSPNPPALNSESKNRLN